MNKIEVFDNVVDREVEPLRNFLDGLLYLDEFSSFYNILKSFKFDFEVLGSFKYSEDRESLEETMRIFQIRINDLTVTNEVIDQIMEKYIEGERFNVEYTYIDNILTVKLL